MNLPLMIAVMHPATAPSAPTLSLFGSLVDMDTGEELLAPQPIYPGNGVAWVAKGLRYFDAAAGRTRFLNSATVTALIATSDDQSAIAADPALSVVCPYIAGSRGDYAIQLPASVLTFARLDPIFGTPEIDAIYIRDDFNRPDAETLGVDESYTLPWRLRAAYGTWGIRNNQARALTIGSNGIATAYHGLSVAPGVLASPDMVVRATLGDPGAIGISRPFLMARVSDDMTNMLYVQSIGGEISLWWQVNDEPTPVGSALYTAKAGDVWEISCVGPRITVLVNGEQLFPSEDTVVPELLTGTLAGIGATDLTGAWDDFQIAIPPIPTPYLIVQQANGFRVARQLQYLPSRLL